MELLNFERGKCSMIAQRIDGQQATPGVGAVRHTAAKSNRRPSSELSVALLF